MPYRFFEGKPVRDSRLCATHWGPWREVLLLSNLHFTVTPPPHPQCPRIRPNSGRDTKVQLKTPFSHLEHPINGGSRKGNAGWSKSKLSPKANRVSQKASSRASDKILQKAQGGNFVTEGSPRAVGRGPENPSGAGVESVQGRASAPAPESRGLELPAAAGPGPLVPALYLGLPAARGRTLGRVSGRPAPGSRRPMSPGPGPLWSSSPPPPGSRRWDEPRVLAGRGSRSPN